MSQFFSEHLKNAVINTSTSGNNTIIAAPTSPAYLVIDHVNVLPTTAVSVTFKSGSTAVTGPYPLDTKQPITLENAILNPDGVITCAPGEAFVMTLGAAVQVGGFVRYRIRQD